MDHDAGTEQSRGEQPGGDQAGGERADPLLAVRARLDEVDDLPLGERAEVFARTHEVVTDELKKLELS